MRDFFTNLVTGIGVWDIIDIAIIALILYKALGFIRESRAEQLVKGLIILVSIWFLAGLLHLYALSWILRGVMNFGIIALVVVFQPELRRALERIGRNDLLHPQFQSLNKEEAKQSVTTIVKTASSFSANKIGALIIIERRVTLNDFGETGVILNSDISEQVLGNLFYLGSPLHDGAVLIRGNKIYAAGVVLPLTRNKDIPRELGTRHMAGIGITEVSDALAIIISEESGIISLADDGKLRRFLDAKALEKEVLNLYLGNFAQEKPKTLRAWIRRALGLKLSFENINSAEQTGDKESDVPGEDR